MKASVLAVGTELTSGQITNRNAAWISQRLSLMGLPSAIHITVPDDRTAIRDSLKVLQGMSDFIFVTGGLGPTSDDFTRELISEWAELPLEFHEASWKNIQDRLNSRGIPIQDFQKQQCYFPKTAQVLENSQGTANAFYLQCHSKHMWVLPGPPNEIKAVWEDHIQAQMSELTKNINPFVTYSWDALGLGEAVAPTLVEPIIQGSGADIGYRVHMPYLEIKFSFFKSEEKKMQAYLAKIEEALKEFTVSRNGEDILQSLNQVLTKAPHVFVCDEVSQGLLLSRLQTILKKDFTYSTDKSVQAQGTSWQIQCHFINEFQFELTLLSPTKKPFKKVIDSPYSKNPHMTERRRQYFAEMALITAVQYWRDA